MSLVWLDGISICLYLIRESSVLEQAQRLQKRELYQQRNGVDGEDVHMSSAKASNGERQRKRKRARGDVEMADAEVQD